jgi:hypothetical protein
LSFVPVIRDKDFDLHKELNALRELVQKAREERPYRVAKRSMGMSGDFRRYGSIVGTKDVTASAKALIEHYQKGIATGGHEKGCYQNRI